MNPRMKKNVIAVTPGGDITLDHILGFYAMFSVPDQPVSASKLSQQWALHGLPPGAVPNARKAVHGFQVACRSVETRRTDASERTTEIKADQVVDGPSYCVYQLTRMVRNKADEEIDFPKALKVIYDKAADEIRWEALDKTQNVDDLNHLGEAIENHYKANIKKVPGARVRAAVRTLMSEVGATNVRKRAGGIYFVPKTGKKMLDDLSEVLEALYGEEAELHLIFAANADGEKAMVEKHFTLNVSSEVDELMAEVASALNSEGRGMRSDRVNNILVERKMLGARKEEYTTLLNTDLSEVKTKLDLLDQQLESLILKQGT